MDWQPFVDLATEMIATYGRNVTIQKFTSAPADPTKPGEGNQTITQSIVVKACFVPVSGFDLGQSFAAEDLFKTSEQVCMIGQQTVNLEGFHTILDSDNTKWRIETGQTLAPGDTILLYAFGIRR